MSNQPCSFVVLSSSLDEGLKLRDLTQFESTGYVRRINPVDTETPTRQFDPMKKIVRNQSDKVLTGLCGGLARAMELDPLLVRLGTVLLTFVTGLVPGIITYIVGVCLTETSDSGNTST